MSERTVFQSGWEDASDDDSYSARLLVLRMDEIPKCLFVELQWDGGDGAASHGLERDGVVRLRDALNKWLEEGRDHE